MRWTICYGMMFISLGSVLVYTVANADELGSSFGDPCVFVGKANARESGIVVHATPSPATPRSSPASATAAPITTATPQAPADTAAPAPAATTSAVNPGMTTDEITLAFGQPDMVSDDGSRWTYGATVFIFNDQGRLSGTVGFDPVQAAINKYNSAMASIADDVDAAPSGKGGARMLSHKSPNYSSQYGPYSRYRGVTAASSRDAYRYNTTGQEYSYYMNRYGPMDRAFLRKPSLPRGMTTSYDRNLSGPYQAFGNRSRYGVSPNIEYRR